jgi:hypothetical protein
MTTEAYIDFCYSMRGAEIEDVKDCSTKEDDDFAKLAHYIWRLGATRAQANRVVQGMLDVPSLQQISCIWPIKNAPETIPKTIDQRFLSPHEILHSICAESAFHNPLQSKQAFARLYHLDRPSDRPIYNQMTRHETIVTRVHAELQLADTFSRSSELKFVDDDKYIGCSKPACYFCYNWLCSHKHDYVKPATHHKVIPGCRGPDQSLNYTGAGVLMDMYSNISRQIGQDVFAFLQQNAQPRTQYMSTEAPSRASSRMAAV